MRPCLPACLLCLSAALQPMPALSGAWPRERGEAYAKASLGRLTADEMFDSNGERRPLFDPAQYANGTYQELGAALYVEYGFLRSLTLVASLPLKVARQEADGVGGAEGIYGESDGLGDAHLGVRVPVHRGRWVAALEPDLKVPLYDLPSVETSDPVLGSGFVDLGVALSVGGGVPSVGGYAQGSVGYRLRGGSTAEETYWDAEVGATPLPPIRLRLRYDGIDSRMEGATPPGGGAPIPNAGEQDVHRIAPTLALTAGPDLEVSLTWRAVIGGVSTSRTSEWEIAVAFLGPVLPK